MPELADADPAGMALFAGVVGQERAVAELRAAWASPVHAYLLVGPAGCGKRAAARSFAAGLLCPQGGCGTCRHCRLALAERHPDLVVVERAGPAIAVDEARQVTRLASRAPMEAGRQVLVLTDFHLVERAAPALLKTIEEPPATTVFVILADQLVPELVTIASRCLVVQLRPLAPADLVHILRREGTDEATATEVAAMAGGRLDRARRLAADPARASRLAAWRNLPGRLDGSGSVVARAVEELLGGLDGALAGERARQAAEIDRLAEAARSGAEGAGGRRQLEDRHRRELRQARAEELRAGLAALAAAYRERLEALGRDAPAGTRMDGVVAALGAIDHASQALERNPNEVLLLQALLLALSPSRI